ncbi:ATP-dependent DNA ligase [Haladaptatus caseinilyticus]|uniref:ATP-dependent DNA ligase n=1 Tax=Haladaptatus caseinilyticus TaxID=2993314 RepID=UPI00224AAC33|nr:ATP-dependent DNA ligase [Haladaptatus caseinilyticus]
MDYALLVDTYQHIEETSSTLEKTGIIARLFADADDDLLAILVKLVRGHVFAEWRPDELGMSSQLTREAISKATGVSETEIEDWWRESGDLGDAAAIAVENQRQRTLFSTTLDVRTVHDDLREIAAYEGTGSRQRKVDTVARLVSNASPDEARYLVRTVVGAMRIGVGDGTIRDAIVDAFLNDTDTGRDAVERAYQLTNDYRIVADTARDSGLAGLSDIDIELFRPIRVMLATKAETIADGLADVASDPNDVYAEYKYDGMRVQIHVRGDDVGVFTRRLEDVTTQFPDVVSAVSEHVDIDHGLVEGEIVAYEPKTHDLVPFQQLSQRIKRKNDIEQISREIPVVVYLFDLLFLEGESLLEEPLRYRLRELEQRIAPKKWTLERAEGRSNLDENGIRSFYREALDAGHEGLMLKNLAVPYQPGSRVGHMMKLKPTMEPLDLVVTRAKYSEGRRSNELGRLFLACRDEDTESFREVGRLATGYTDAELAELTERLEPNITATDGRAVELVPEVVIEVEYEEIQRSPTYDSNMALRFPRFVRFRDDLSPEEADSLERVHSLFDDQR